MDQRFEVDGIELEAHLARPVQIHPTAQPGLVIAHGFPAEAGGGINSTGSFPELAESDLKIVIQDPRSSTPGLGLLLWVEAAYRGQAPTIWQGLADNVLTVTKGWSEAYGMFLEGEADMVLSYTTSPAYHQIVEEETRYQAAAFAEGHGMQIEVAGMLKNAPNPDLARQFLAFMLTPDFQSLIPTGNWMYPVVFPEEGLPEAFGTLVQPARSLAIDAQGVTDNRLDWIDEFNQALSQ